MAKGNNLNAFLILSLCFFLFIIMSKGKTDAGESLVLTNVTKPHFIGGGGGGGGGGGSSSALASAAEPSFKVMDWTGQELTVVDWGVLAPGENVSVPVNFVCYPSSDAFSEFYVSAYDFEPALAEEYLTVSLVNGSIVLAVSPLIEGVGTFTFKVLVTGVES